MASFIENNLGLINIENEVIARIAGNATSECCGLVDMAVRNVKDGIVKSLKIESITKGVKIKTKGNLIQIDLHIIVGYGTNIIAISETIKSTVKYKVENLTGLKVEKVNIFVEGIRVDNI